MNKTGTNEEPEEESNGDTNMAMNDVIVPEVLAAEAEAEAMSSADLARQGQNGSDQDETNNEPNPGRPAAAAAVPLMEEQQQMELEDMTQLQMHIELGEWDMVEKRLQTHPDEILPGRMTALHIALEGGDCPFGILKTMLELEPLLPSIADKTGGNLPLHVACAGEYAYDPVVLAMLLAAYPQATLQQDAVDCTTPLHMLLQMGGDVNLTSLQLLLDVAYSPLARLPLSFVLGLQFLARDDLGTSLLIVENYPPLMVRVVLEMAHADPMNFPAFLRPFLHMPVPTDTNYYRVLLMAKEEQQRNEKKARTENMKEEEEVREETAHELNGDKMGVASPSEGTGTATTTGDSDQPPVASSSTAAAEAVTTTTQQPSSSPPPSQQQQEPPHLLLMRDNAQQVPLHICCRRGIGPGTTKLLLQYPGGRESVTLIERKDRYPLHYAAIYAMPVEAAKAVYEAGPRSMAHVRERYGLTSYELAHSGPPYLKSDRTFELVEQHMRDSDHDRTADATAVSNGSTIVRRRSTSWTCRSNAHVTKDLFKSPKSHQLFHMMWFYLRITDEALTNQASLLQGVGEQSTATTTVTTVTAIAESQQHDNGDQDTNATNDDWRILDAACRVPSPPAFLRCLSKLFGWQLSTRNNRGYLPLHYASGILRPDGSNDMFSWLPKMIPAMDQIAFRLLPEQKAVDNCITVICKACPRAARCLTPQDDLPLHLAVLSGKAMDEGIASLIDAAPMALATRNMTHRLYPFQLAAIDNVNSLDVVYTLLLANPMMVRLF